MGMNHVKQAENLLGLRGRNGGIDSTSAGVLLAEAQVHATLALVEQQRIANLIALANLTTLDGFESEVYDARLKALMEGLLDREEVAAVVGYGPAGVDEYAFIRPAIAAALGLGGEPDE